MIQEKVNLLAREELLIRDVPQSDDFEWCMDIGEYHGEEKKHQADDRLLQILFWPVAVKILKGHSLEKVLKSS